MEITLLLILLFPLLGAAINGLLVRRAKPQHRVISWCSTTFFRCICVLYIMNDGFKYPVQLLLFWMDTVWKHFYTLPTLYGSLTAVFVFVITGIGFFNSIGTAKHICMGTKGSIDFYLPQPVYIFHVGFGNGFQLSSHVCRMGRRRFVFLFADWILVQNTDYSKGS